MSLADITAARDVLEEAVDAHQTTVMEYSERSQGHQPRRELHPEERQRCIIAL